MMLIDLLTFLRFLVLLGWGLFVPGWLLGRALGVSGGPAGALLGSAALLTNLILLLDALGVRLDAPRLCAALAVLCAGLAFLARRRSRAPVEASPPRMRTAWRWQSWHGLLIPAVIGFMGIIARVSLDPLSGWDCPFRWEWLAREMIHTGNLRFYPAITADDFRHYGWCDGIAPLVSGLYAWAYLSLGRMAAWATTPVVVAQGLLIFYLVGRLAAARSGPAAGAVAVALLAISPVFLWSVAMGQETGMTALSAIAMFWFIERGRTDFRTGWMIWAGLAAGTGGLAREYGLALIPLGLLALAWWRLPRRGWLAFTVAAAAVAFPWYLRNWIKTGNPLYSLGDGTLFPVNPVHLEWTQGLAKINRLMGHLDVAIPSLAKLVGLLAGPTLVLGLATGLVRWRTSGPWLTAAFCFAGLWLWSVSYTAGGYVYSLRVLTPVIALAAVLGGIGLARLAGGRRQWILVAVLTVAAVESAEGALFLPLETLPMWWQHRFFAWRDLSKLSRLLDESPNWRAVTSAAEGRLILVSDPSAGRMLTDHGAHVVPLFSPDVRFLFEPVTGLKEATARLRAAGYRFILITRGNLPNDTLLRAHPFFVALEATKPAGTTPFYFIYDLYSAGQRRADPVSSVPGP